MRRCLGILINSAYICPLYGASLPGFFGQKQHNKAPNKLKNSMRELPIGKLNRRETIN